MNFLSEVIGAGFKGALIKFFKMIFFILIILICVYIIGLVSSRKVSALTIKESMYDPDINNKEQTYDFWNGNRQAWLDFNFASNITINNDYDLISFKVNQNSSIVYNTGQNQVWDVENLFVVTPILWQTDGTGIMCYFSGEYKDVFVCPIQHGVTYRGVSLVVNVVDNNIDFIIHYMVILERTKTFMNFDDTDIITYFQGSTGFSGIVVEQQETNDLLEDSIDVQTDTNTYIKDNNTTTAQTDTTNSLNSVSGQFNDILNGWGGEWSSLTHVILEPINVILYAFDPSTTCSPIVLNVPFVNTQITLPCMSGIYNQYFSSFISIFIIGISGLYAYRTIIYVIRTLKDVIDAENDKIEVIDL